MDKSTCLGSIVTLLMNCGFMCARLVKVSIIIPNITYCHCVDRGIWSNFVKRDQSKLRFDALCHNPSVSVQHISAV